MAADSHRQPQSLEGQTCPREGCLKHRARARLSPPGEKPGSRGGEVSCFCGLKVFVLASITTFPTPELPRPPLRPVFGKKLLPLFHLPSAGPSPGD